MPNIQPLFPNPLPVKHPIGHFQVAFLAFACVSKQILARNHSAYENVFPPQVQFHANQTHLHMKGFGTKTRFKTEEQGNSGMAYRSFSRDVISF